MLQVRDKMIRQGLLASACMPRILPKHNIAFEYKTTLDSPVSSYYTVLIIILPLLILKCNCA